MIESVNVAVKASFKGQSLPVPRIAMNNHTGDPIHGHTAYTRRVSTTASRSAYSRCVATCTRREKKPSPHMTYDRRRSCSAPEETTGLAGSCKTQQCRASSPLPCAPAPPSAARRLRRPLLNARVCVYARMVCTCVSAALTEAMHARHGAPSTHHGSGGGGAPRAQDSAQPSSDCRCSAAASTCAQYSAQPSSDCRCSAAASTRTRRCTSSTGNLVFAIRAGSSCSNQRSC